MRVKCGCGALLKVPDSVIGKRVRCPKCKAPIDVSEKPADDTQTSGEPAPPLPPPKARPPEKPEPSEPVPKPAQQPLPSVPSSLLPEPSTSPPASSEKPETAPPEARYPPSDATGRNPSPGAPETSAFSNAKMLVVAALAATRTTLAYPGWIVVSVLVSIAVLVGFGVGQLMRGAGAEEPIRPAFTRPQEKQKRLTITPGKPQVASSQLAEEHPVQDARNGPSGSALVEATKDSEPTMITDEESDIVEASLTETALEQPEDPGRPEHMPCRVEVYWSRGDLRNWWSLRYEGGRLVAARDERLGYRQASVKISTVEKVDAKMNQKAYSLGYEYDDSGRLVHFSEEGTDSEPGMNVKFTYAGDGKLDRYSDEYGEHTLSLSADDSGAHLVDTDKYSMAGMRVAVRYEYPSREHPLLGRPMVWGRDLLFGEETTHFKFPGKPEALIRRVKYDGPGGGISEMRGFGLGGYPGDRYEFVYDCSEPVRWQ